MFFQHLPGKSPLTGSTWCSEQSNFSFCLNKPKRMVTESSTYPPLGSFSLLNALNPVYYRCRWQHLHCLLSKSHMWMSSLSLKTDCSVNTCRFNCFFGYWPKWPGHEITPPQPALKRRLFTLLLVLLLGPQRPSSSALFISCVLPPTIWFSRYHRGLLVMRNPPPPSFILSVLTGKWQKMT